MRIKHYPKLGQSSLLFLALAVALAACTPAEITPGVETQIAESVDATLTAMPMALPTLTPEPTEPPASPTPTVTQTPTPRPTLPVPTVVAPVSATFPDASYVLLEERLMGEYAVRIWRNDDSPSEGLDFDSLLTVEQTGQSAFQVDYFTILSQLTGTDLTGDGTPELVAISYTGGAHCCTGVTAYSLGETATLLLQTRPSNCGGQFVDLDADGILEFVTCDDVFAYTYCPYAASPIVRAILAYTPETGYAAAGPRFADQYTPDIVAQAAEAEVATPGGLGEWDNTTKCGVLPLVLTLLYSGQPDLAWSELARLYKFTDEAQFRQEIEQTAGTSPLFTLP